MRVPIRKGGEFSDLRPDPKMTKKKFEELSLRLQKIKEIIRPRQASDVKKYAADGDFSENAAYQIAKGKLRRTNQELKELEDLLGKAEIIHPNSKKTIQVGHSVSLGFNGQEIKYQILGSVETDPSKVVISHSSPLGQLLLDKKVGDIIELKTEERNIKYQVLKIE